MPPGQTSALATIGDAPAPRFECLAVAPQQPSALRFQPSGFRSQGFQNAFSLVEVALALGLISFCLLAVFGLLPVGVTSNQASIEQTAAANIARNIIADLHSTPASAGTSSTSSLYGINIPAAGGGSTISTTPQTLFFSADGSYTSAATISGNAPSRYRVAVGFAPPATGQKSATAVRLLITWPALADQTQSTWPLHFSGSYETVTALDRN